MLAIILVKKNHNKYNMSFGFFFQINVVFLVFVLRAIFKARSNKHHRKSIKGKKETNKNVETAK